MASVSGDFSNDLSAARVAQKPDYIALLRETGRMLGKAGTPDGIRRSGGVAADFALIAPTGETVTLSGLLADGPVVISFFRGEWCPFCQTELRALLAAQPAMAARGATLILISPEQPSGALLTKVAAQGDRVWILHDAMLGVALRYGLVHRIPSALRNYYVEVGFDIPTTFRSGSWLLPLPADFVIGRDGRIALSYADVDVTIRLDPLVILEALDQLPT